MGYLKSVKVFIKSSYNPRVLDRIDRNVIHTTTNSSKLKIVKYIL
jgi:hypothetical protein